MILCTGEDLMLRRTILSWHSSRFVALRHNVALLGQLLGTGAHSSMCKYMYHLHVLKSDHYLSAQLTCKGEAEAGSSRSEWQRCQAERWRD